VFSSPVDLQISFDEGQAYFKGCAVKAAPKDRIETSDGLLPVSPIQLRLHRPDVGNPTFDAVGLEGMTYALPKEVPPVLVHDLTLNEASRSMAEQHVYSDTPVGVFFVVRTQEPTVPTTVTVGGNLDAAAAVSPPLNRPFLSAEDTLLKQYQAESVRLLLCFYSFVE
jgi:hypothetical protein